MSKWSFFHDGGHRYELTNTNLAEVFNYMMNGVRFVLSKTLVEFTLYLVNYYFVQRCERASA